LRLLSITLRNLKQCLRPKQASACTGGGVYAGGSGIGSNKVLLPHFHLEHQQQQEQQELAKQQIG
jgi:hypothetical protein